MVKAQVLSLEGKPIREIELPAQFKAEVREDLIARAAISDQTKKYQPKGNYTRAGMETSARYRGRKDDFGSGKNKGTAMRPREVLPKGRLGRVKRIPSAVKGRRAHPPKVEKIIIERINKKEYSAALRSAIAATASRASVLKRGHMVDEKAAFPIVFDNSFEKLEKTSEVFKVLMLLIGKDFERAGKKKKRTGVRCRKAGCRRPVSAIIIVSKGSQVLKAGRNLPGVDAVCVSELTVEKLAPGAKAGRLAIYSEAALEEISKI